MNTERVAGAGLAESSETLPLSARRVAHRAPQLAYPPANQEGPVSPGISRLAPHRALTREIGCALLGRFHGSGSQAFAARRADHAAQSLGRKLIAFRPRDGADQSRLSHLGRRARIRGASHTDPGNEPTRSDARSTSTSTRVICSPTCMTIGSSVSANDTANCISICCCTWRSTGARRANIAASSILRAAFWPRTRPTRRRTSI